MRKILRCFCLSWLLPDSAHNWKGEVVNVADGDTINVRRGKETVRIRLYGVDCPESRQKYGSEATEFARKLLLGKKCGWKLWIQTSMAALWVWSMLAIRCLIGN